MEFCTLANPSREVMDVAAARGEIASYVWPRPKVTSLNIFRASNRVIFVEKGDEIDVVASMPQNGGRGSRVRLFPLGCPADDEKVEGILREHSLVAADPLSLSAVLNKDPIYGERYRERYGERVCVGTHWKDRRGCWWHIAFCVRFDGTQLVYIARGPRVWPAEFWIAGMETSHVRQVRVN